MFRSSALRSIPSGQKKRRLRRHEDRVLVDASDRFLEHGRAFRERSAREQPSDPAHCASVTHLFPVVPRACIILAKDPRPDGTIPFTLAPVPEDEGSDQHYLEAYRERGWNHVVYQEKGLPLAVSVHEGQDDPFETLFLNYFSCSEFKRSHPIDFLNRFCYEPC